MLIWCTAVATMSVWSPWDVATWLTWLLMALISSEVMVSFLAVSARCRSSACWLSSIILKARAVSDTSSRPRASARSVRFEESCTRRITPRRSESGRMIDRLMNQAAATMRTRAAAPMSRKVVRMES